MEPTENHDIDDAPSKSQRKRDMHRLQTLGTRLAALAPERLAQVPVSERLRGAIEELRRIRGREALRRQRQYLGRLMRLEDEEAIATTLERLEAGGVAQKRLLHELEHWRDRLIGEGDDALRELLETCPGADRQHLRQLIRTAQQEREQERPPAASRKLFRYLRELMPDA